MLRQMWGPTYTTRNTPSLKAEWMKQNYQLNLNNLMHQQQLTQS